MVVSFRDSLSVRDGLLAVLWYVVKMWVDRPHRDGL